MNKDDLSIWCEENLDKVFFKNTDEVINEYIRVTTWANSKKDHYKTTALNEFLESSEADAWLVACVLKDTCKIVTHEVDLAMLSQQQCKVKLFLRSRLVQAFKQGNLYYLLCCKPENLIYDQSKEALPLIDATQWQQQREALRQLFDFSGAMAQSFLEQAKMNKEKGDWRMAIFLLQQCAERCCRSVIKGFTGEERKTHEISALAKQLDMIAPRMRMALGDDEAKDVRLLKLLDSAYAKARYLESFRINPADLDRLFEMVDLLFVETGRSFKELLGLGG